MTELRQLRETERRLAWVQVVGVSFAIFRVAAGTDYPPNYEQRASGCDASGGRSRGRTT